MATTILDVAKRAGVSKSTVSLVINNSPLIKQSTKEKVYAAIRELRYVPNMTARSLSTSKTALIGMIISREKDDLDTIPYFQRETYVFSHDVIEGVPRGLNGEKYGLLTEYYSNAAGTQDLPCLISGRRIDGAIVIGSLYNSDFFKRARDFNIPMSAAGRRYDDIDSVYADVEMGIYLAAERVIKGGARVLCYVNCPERFLSHSDRRLGFERACNAYPDHSRSDIHIACESNSGIGAYNAISELWSRGIQPDGIVAANETIALGVMRFLYEKKLRIPDDVSIAGYEASILGAYSAPCLTTVNINKHSIGERAALLLLDRLNDRDRDVQHICIEPELVERDTVRPIQK